MLHAVVLGESPCPRGSSRTNLQVPVLVLGPLKIVKDFAFRKQSVMYYDHAKSINSVTVTMHEDKVKNALLTDVRYYLLIYVSK